MNNNTPDSNTLGNHSTASLSTHDGDQNVADMVPPFLVRTKTREEKDFMRQQFKKQETATDRGTYNWLQKIYARFSTSFMLENKAATARDHLGNDLFIHATSFISCINPLQPTNVHF